MVTERWIEKVGGWEMVESARSVEWRGYTVLQRLTNYTEMDVLKHLASFQIVQLIYLSYRRISDVL